MKTATQAMAIHIPADDREGTNRIVTIDVPVRWDELIEDWMHPRAGTAFW